MELWGDRRGQPVQIGFLLLFGVLVLAFAGYQGYVVPNQNAGVEFDHFRTVGDEFGHLESTVVDAVGTDAERSAALTLGVQYPSRLLASNPPPAAGTLRTTAARPVRVEAPGAGDLTAEVCGSADATSRSLVYVPDYNEFESARSTTYENGFVTRGYGDGDLHGRQRLVRDVEGGPDRVDLLLLNGSVGENGRGTYGLGINATHRYGTTVRNPRVTLPSRFSERAWEEEILGDRDDVRVEESGDGSVELRFDGGEYRVSCAVVGLDREPAFVPPVGETPDDSTFDTRWDEDDPVTVREGGNVTLTALVSQRGGDAVDDAAVDFAVEAGVQDRVAELRDADGATDDGEANVTLAAGENAGGEAFEVYVTAGDDSDVVTVEVEEGPGRGNGG